MALIDKNSDKIPEGDYLELCDTIHELRRQVKPPSFLLDQNQPLTYAPMTDGQPHDWMDDELPSDPDTAAQRAREELHQRWRELDEEVMYPGLNQFLQELHEEWSDPVEPGAYYPPPTHGMHQHVEDGTTVAEVSMMDID
jgi:hypothetical protein